MTTPTTLSEDDAKEAYLKRCMDMTHGQLYAELMRVHKEATALVQQAVEHERRGAAESIRKYVEDMDKDYKELGEELATLVEGVKDGLNS